MVDGDGNLAVGRQGHGMGEGSCGCGTAVDVIIVDGGRVVAVGHHPHNYHRGR